MSLENEHENQIYLHLLVVGVYDKFINFPGTGKKTIITQGTSMSLFLIVEFFHNSCEHNCRMISNNFLKLSDVHQLVI